MTTDVLNGAPPAGIPSEQGNPAAAQPNAATADPQTGGEEGGTESQVPKTFTQDELNDIIRKEKAKAEAKAERRVLRTLEKLQPAQHAPQTSQPAERDSGRPTPKQGETTDAYLERLTDWKLEQRDREAAQHRQHEQQRTLAQKTESIYAEAEKLPGFDRESFDDLPLTRHIVEALVESDAPAKLMAYMAANPAEVERIAKLSAARQAAEIGKLEAAVPKAPRTSKAPDPIGDPTARGSTTTVPTDPNRMTHEQYREWRKKQGARWAQ